MKRSLIAGLCLTFLVRSAAAEWEEYFEFERIATPPGLDAQVGGLASFPDGRLAVVFHRGEAMIYDPKTGAWSLFANGLQEPLGVVIEADGSLVVMQRAELTRLKDGNGDGRADRYETLCDDFGLTGNYHEFAFGPAVGPDGRYYVALNLASNGASIRREIRGEFSPIGQLSREEMTEIPGWYGGKNEKAGRMYARVPWRGWILSISPDGGEMIPHASGFRSPDGIGFDAAGRLLVTDNEGDWRPTSPLYSVAKGSFNGHPASLVWKEGWDGRDPIDPEAVPVSELIGMHDQPAGYFPQGELANSPTQPVVIPAGALPGKLAGQTLIGEMNQPTLVRVLDDEVDGIHQAGLVSFLKDSPLGNGNHRLAFAPDGSLYVGKTALSWAGSAGITKVKWRGSPLPVVENIKARPEGFELGFSEAIDPSTLAGLALKRHTYHYHSTYGSPKVDERTVQVKAAALDEAGTGLTFECGPLEAGFLYLIDLSAMRTKEGGKLLGDKVWYHVVKVPR